MAQISGALTLELDLDRLADLVAARVVTALRQRGDDTYRRDDPAASGARHGYREISVTDHGEVSL